MRTHAAINRPASMSTAAASCRLTSYFPLGRAIGPAFTCSSHRSRSSRAAAASRGSFLAQAFVSGSATRSSIVDGTTGNRSGGCTGFIRGLSLAPMNSLAEIESAVASLSPPQQEELLRHLAERVRQQGQPKRRLPVVAATGREITQREIDDACDAQ
jgi:hypothetical protein